MDDSIYVINLGGYIGDSTRLEMEYAISHDKAVQYLEPNSYSDWEMRRLKDNRYV